MPRIIYYANLKVILYNSAVISIFSESNFPGYLDMMQDACLNKIPRVIFDLLLHKSTCL